MPTFYAIKHDKEIPPPRPARLIAYVAPWQLWQVESCAPPASSWSGDSNSLLSKLGVSLCGMWELFHLDPDLKENVAEAPSIVVRFRELNEAAVKFGEKCAEVAGK